MTGIDERAERWAATMSGHQSDGIHFAHADSWAGSGSRLLVSRKAREERQSATQATLATKALGAGQRAIEEAPDEWRTCFDS